MVFRHIAGDPMLDLLNTVSWRLDEVSRRERLRDYGDVIDWCVESSLLSQGEETALRGLAERDPSSAERERALVVVLRERAYAMLLSGDHDAAADLSRNYADAFASAALVRIDDAWKWRDAELTIAAPRHRIARGLVDLVRSDGLERLHQCEDAKCGHVYLDASPRRNRRWCDSKDCGDRNRTRAYDARRRASARSRSAAE